MSTQSPNNGRNGWRVFLDLLDRFLTSLVGVRRDLLNLCPEDRLIIYKLAVAILLSGAWLCLLLSNAARIMFAPNGEWSVEYVAIATLVTAIIVLADILIFIAGSWHAHGIAELYGTGQFQPHSPFGGRAKTIALMACRFAMALLTANFLAVVAGLLAFDKDTGKVIESWYQQSNAVLYREAAIVVDGEIKENLRQQEEFRRQIADAEKEEARLRITTVDPNDNDAEWRLALENLSRAEMAKVDAERTLRDAEGASADEIGGTCERRGHVCPPGRGPRWRAAQDRIGAAQRAVAEATRVLELAQRKLDELRPLRGQNLGRKTEAAQARLGEVTKNKQSLQAQLAALEERRQDLQSNRERRIKVAVESDPRHFPREDGLVARLRALRELMKEPAIAALIYVFDGMLVFLELAAIMGKVVGFVPMAYATALAERDLTRAYETARRLRAVMSDVEAAPPVSEAPPLVPRPSDIESIDQETNGKVARVSSRGSRHGPRWQPPPRSAGTQVPAGHDTLAPGPTNADGIPPSLPPSA